MTIVRITPLNAVSYEVYHHGQAGVELAAGLQLPVAQLASSHSCLIHHCRVYTTRRIKR